MRDEVRAARQLELVRRLTRKNRHVALGASGRSQCYKLFSVSFYSNLNVYTERISAGSQAQVPDEI